MTTGVDISAPRKVPGAKTDLRQILGLAPEPHIWELMTLDNPNTQTIWVAPEMMGLLVEVAATVPDDVMVADVPRPLSGIVMFSETVVGHDAQNPEGNVNVQGYMWADGGVEFGTPRYPVRRECLMIGALGWLPPEKQAIVDASLGRTSTSPVLVPMGRSEWVPEEPLSDMIDFGHRLAGPDPVTKIASAVEDRRLLVALFTLIRQERHVEATAWVPHNKAARRRYKGADLTVVNLRRTSNPDAGRHTSGGQLTHRTWVNPYLRMQPYGPGQSLRRLQLVDGHIRGPEDSPLVRRERVWALRR